MSNILTTFLRVQAYIKIDPLTLSLLFYGLRQHVLISFCQT